MPLITTRMVPQGHLISTDIKQYADLLTGVMTDQPVDLANTLNVQGKPVTISPDAGNVLTWNINGLFVPTPSPGLTLPLTQPLTFSPDNTHDIGAAGANRPRSIYAATSFIGPGAVPAGGTANQMLAKTSATDYDVGWATPSAGVSWPLLAPNGSSAAPSYAFSVDPTSGIWAAGTTGSHDVVLNAQRYLYFYTGGTNKWSINQSGHLYAGTDGVHDIGNFGTARPRNLFLTSYVQQAVIATPANPPSGSLRIYPKSDGHLYQLDSAGVEIDLAQAGGGAATTFEQEFTPAASATTVTLSQTPADVLYVSRNGLVQSEGLGHYTWAGTTVTFTDAFNGSERVIVAYTIGTVEAATAALREEFLPANAATTVTVTTDPTGVVYVSRNGVVQSLTDNHYSRAGKVFTFTQAFDGTERVVVSYTVGMVGAQGPAGASGVAHDEFTPANLATTVTLSQVPVSILTCARGGVVQSQGLGDYSLSGSVVTFSDAFDGTERVVIDYVVQTVTPAPPFNGAGLTDGTVSNAKLASDTARANLLTNGGFEIWQRGNGPFMTNGFYTADRWQINWSGTDTMSVQKNTATVDVGSNASAAVAFTLGTGAGVSNLLTFLKPSDGCGLQGRTVSASVRVNVGTANAVRIGVVSDTAPAESFSTFHTGVAGWQTLTATYSVSATATIVYVLIHFAASCTAYLDNAMLVVGSAPSDYAPLHPADDLARCQRYYEKLAGDGDSSLIISGIAQGGGVVYHTWLYRMPKPVTPSVNKAGTWGGTNCNQPSIDAAGLGACRMPITVSAAGSYYTNNNAAGTNITVEANP